MYPNHSLSPHTATGMRSFLDLHGIITKRWIVAWL